MSADDASSYRPKSPDLSSFFSGSVEPQPQPTNNNSHHHQPQHHNPQQNHDHYQHRHHDSLNSQHSSVSPYLPHPPPLSHDQRYPQNPQPYDFSPHPQPTAYGYSPSTSFGGAPFPDPASPRAIKSEEQHSYLPPAHGALPPTQPGPYASDAPHNIYHQPPAPPAPYNPSYDDPSFQPFPGATAPYAPQYPQGPDSKVEIFDQKPLLNMSPQDTAPPAASRPPPINLPDPSPVRTKFPTARIKRIMQADEEVGKVAQQTPIAVGKALEMFMVQLVLTSADVAKEKGSKRVTAQMLKQVVETDEQWDFLRDIVGKVESGEKGGKAAKAESESEEEEPKKKGKGVRKRKTG